MIHGAQIDRNDRRKTDPKRRKDRGVSDEAIAEIRRELADQEWHPRSVGRAIAQRYGVTVLNLLDRAGIAESQNRPAGRYIALAGTDRDEPGEEG